MDNHTDGLSRWQTLYVLGGLAIAPLGPLLYLQGQITRWKVGALPPAAGPLSGLAGEGDPHARLLALGESTVAGLGARDHERALAGRFAHCLSEHLGRAVEWEVVGLSGVTARRTIDELLPQIPDKPFDHILLGIGGNDVLHLSSPRRWRRDMQELIGLLRDRFPAAVIFISNCPMIGLSPVIPQPTRSILWRLSQMHNDNMIEFTAALDRVFYYPQPAAIRREGFFSDGVHPSEQGYSDWAAAMMRYFAENCAW